MKKFTEFRKYNWKLRLGIILIIISCLVFMSLIFIPFLKIENKVKLTLTTIIIVIGEIAFWSGGILVGKELFSKYKSYFNPKNWFKKKYKRGLFK